MNQAIQAVFAAIVEGQAPVVQQKVNEALDAQRPPKEILDDGLIAAMAEVGRRFEVGTYYVPDLLISARAMKAGLEILRPRLVQTQVQSVGKVIAGTVRGDLHDIGKNLVCMMLEGAGFEINDLGVNVLPEQFVQALRSDSAHILAMSALLTTTMPAMKETIAALERAGLRYKVKVIVGGAPVTSDFARQIGADGHAVDASRAATLARSLVGYAAGRAGGAG